MWSDDDESIACEVDFKVCVEVSGVYFYTLNSTLQKCPYFKALNISQDDIIFVDREPSLFPYILNYLRSGELCYICEDKAILNQLKSEAIFFGLTDLYKALEKTPSYSMADLISEIRQIKHCIQNNNTILKPNTRRNSEHTLQSNTT